MGKLYASLDDNLRDFMAAQKVFFVGTAPRADDGHVNLSPKGLDSFRVLSPTRVAYLDLIGSGAETAAHVRENGRITFLFCAFEGPPKILRLYGQATVVTPGDNEWDRLAADFPSFSSQRSIIVVELTRIADSCGYGVPLYQYEGQRTQLPAWAEKKGPDGLVAYRKEKNAASIDGLPAFTDD